VTRRLKGQQLLNLVWLVPALPLAAFVINGLFGKRVLKGASDLVAIGAIAGSFALSLPIFLLAVAGETKTFTLYSWIVSGNFSIPIGFSVDGLSATMLLVVSSVSLLVHIYSVGYMHDDPGYYRFFSYLPLFVFSMLMLVLANNFLELYVFWEAVGLCSYLLIGFWYERKSAADAATKAFVVNRIGDFGFGIGVILVFLNFGTLDFAQVFNSAGHLEKSTLTLITLLLFVGAIGKSAQLPLHVWLPDAMEGPTPVSALIHAATMVTAGVYMVARCYPLFAASPDTLTVVGLVGAVTALFAATIALTHTDIKRILAYSTISQLGLMFLALGVGAWIAAIFHLATHAFFKALLFLCSGSVIHSLGGEQNIQKMGGLRRKMPWTFATFVIGALAIAGIPPLSGFFSKDELLTAAFIKGNYLLYVLGALTAILTAFYMFRLIFITFYGRTHLAKEVFQHVHESPQIMIGPMALLAFLTIVAGVVGIPPEGGFIHGILEPVGELYEVAKAPSATANQTTLIMGASVLLALAGIGLAHIMYVTEALDPRRLTQIFKPLYLLFYNKYWVDEIYRLLLVKPLTSGARLLWDWVDVWLIDGAVNGAGMLVAWGSRGASRLQTGRLENYALTMAAGLIAILAIYLIIRG